MTVSGTIKDDIENIISIEDYHSMVFRLEKGKPLTYAELDNNFRVLLNCLKKINNYVTDNTNSIKKISSKPISDDLNIPDGANVLNAVAGKSNDFDLSTFTVNDKGMNTNTVSIVTQTKEASIEVLAGSNVRYSPDKDFVGVDKFTFMYMDNDGDIHNIDVYIKVKGA